MKFFNFICVAATAALMMFSSCTKTPAGENDENDPSGDDSSSVVNPSFAFLSDSVMVSTDGGDFSIDYEFVNRPENGEFTFSYSSEPTWVEGVADDPENNRIVFSVLQNPVSVREITVDVQYEYSDDGSRRIILEDSFVIKQDGKVYDIDEYDIYLKANYCQGEYYHYDNPVIAADMYDNYYLAISDLGLEAPESYQLVVWINAPAPDQEDIDNNRVLCPPGIYSPSEKMSGEMWTFECEPEGSVIGARTFYGFNLTGWPSEWELKHFICDGTITIIDKGDGVYRYEADLLSWFGEKIFVEYEGVPESLIYVDM